MVIDPGVHTSFEFELEIEGSEVEEEGKKTTIKWPASKKS
jgi:hypothetical protein